MGNNWKAESAYAAEQLIAPLLGAYPRETISTEIINLNTGKSNCKNVKNRPLPKCGNRPARARFLEGVYKAMARGRVKRMAGILEGRFEIIQHYSHFLKSDKNCRKPGLNRVLTRFKGMKKKFSDFCKNRRKSLTPFSDFLIFQEVTNGKMV